MEAKLARASHRHRQLAIHHIERQRAAAIKLQPNSNISLPHHHAQSSSKEDKIAALRHRRMKAASVEDSNLIACDRPVRPVIDNNSNDTNAVQAEESEVLNERVNWRPAVSLEEVMVEKRPAKDRIDSFELVCPPISRVIALSDEPSRPKFPQESIEEDEGWERIGIDGELELDNENENENEPEVPPTRSWVGVVLGLEEKPKGTEKFGI